MDQVSLEVVRTGRRLSGFFSGVSGGRKERQEAWWILLVSGGRRNSRVDFLKEKDDFLINF